jgi:hypothetical protein
MKRTLLILVALMMVASVVPAIATTTTLDFYNITNVYGNAANIAKQLSVDVSDVSGHSDQVLFTFYNKGTITSSITEIYFDDGSLLALSNVTNGTGVNFAQGASPANLPAGNSITPEFVASANFLASSASPQVANGVNNYDGSGTQEYVSILFTLQTGKTFNDVITALSLPLPRTVQYSKGKEVPGTDNWLRIGLHVTGLEPTGSESFVNTAVPLPGAVLLLGAGMFRLVAYARRRREE